MKINRRFTQSGQDVFSSVNYEKRTSRITNPDGSVVFEMTDAEMPASWSQLATDIMVSKYFRKAGVPQVDGEGHAIRDEKGNAVMGPEKSARQVIHRLAGCWRHWGETHGYFDNTEDAQAFYDELSYMLLHQMCAPNSPQWFNTGLNFAYGITGPSQGHYFCDPKTGQLQKSSDAYTHPQPHACFIQSIKDDLVNPGGIMDLWTREARLFKYGSGTGTNFSKLRGENEKLSGGGKSSGLMSFLRIGDRAAGAIKSGGTTRRAAKMVCLDLDHPDVEDFVNWKVREEIKVAAMAEGMKHLAAEQKETAKKLGLKLDYDFNGEAYATVSGQNSNNSIRIPNRFFKALEENGDWNLINRVNGKVYKTIKARELWDEICFAAWRCADPGVQFDDTINNWHTCPKSGRINASNPCVTGDTRILTPGGIWRRIDQMIHLPSRVVTNLDGQEIHTTDGSFPTGTKDVYELKTMGGYSLKLTADHEVWTRRRGWVAAKDLNGEDEVRLPSEPACVEKVGEPQDQKFFQLLGLFASDANGCADAVKLDACLKNSEVMEGYINYVNATWAPSTYADDYVNQLMVDHSEDATSGGSQLATFTLANRRLISRLGAFLRSEIIGSGTEVPPPVEGAAKPVKRLGDEAFTAGLAAQKHLLRALFTADAEIVNGTLELRSESAAMLSDVQLLLVGFGVQSTRMNPREERARQAARLNEEGGTLRVLTSSLRAYGKHIGLLPGKKAEQLAQAMEFAIGQSTDSNPWNLNGNWDRVAALVHKGTEQVFDLTEPLTSSFIANGLTVHNCSEYMFLDDTACNLASLNVLTFFDAETRRFDIESFKHGVRLWTIVLEISVLMASFPSEEIAQLSYRYRTLGLGYANLGAMLMQAGVPYDSEKGRAICAAITSILTGESYACSADMAGELGPFPGYHENRGDMLRVIRNHRRAANGPTEAPLFGNNSRESTTPGNFRDSLSPGYRDSNSRLQNIGEYEGLQIAPVAIDAGQFVAGDPLATAEMLSAARECWDRALHHGEMHGYRNAQATVIAPTGTIGLLMDCDTTGVEPDFALVKFKKLAGGGYFKIANQSLRPALVNLGYSPEQINEILRYVMGSLNLSDSPHINRTTLKSRGFADEEIDRIEESLPGVFELGFAFSPWSLGAEIMKRLDIPESESSQPNFNMLRRLGFTKKQIDAANDAICGRGTVEEAPHLKEEHYPVFDCANKCGKIGKRFIAAEGHIRMMAAAQPFISGAISKTINLPNEATIEEIARSYQLSWQLGLKANALYRDGSKLSQPLNVKSDEELDKVEEDDEENVAAARAEVTQQTADAIGGFIKADNVEPVHTHVIEKVIERIVERPLRRRLPDTRNAITHKFDVAGHEGYITAGLYEDGQPGEVFITMAKEGSTIGGLMDAVATLVSVSLQYGVPVESLVRKFEHVRFEPSGMTRNPEIPIAKSLVDYIFRWLAMEFVPGYRATYAPKRVKPEEGTRDRSTGSRQDQAARRSTVSGVEPQGEEEDGEEGVAPKNGNGNGHGRVVAGDVGEGKVQGSKVTAAVSRLAMVADPLSQQGADMQSDAPACDVCGSITVRSGTCYKCLNCGNSMGCS
ncbi:MAG TPA: LAGLIDADG family homing endonuclease [Tepidisphaeraceae bacterium]|jgi:ribonucleoside-diphosphate reductase alpha chain